MENLISTLFWVLCTTILSYIGIIFVNVVNGPVGGAGYFKEILTLEESDELYDESWFFKLFHPPFLFGIKHCGRYMRYVVRKGKKPISYITHKLCEGCRKELVSF